MQTSEASSVVSAREYKRPLFWTLVALQIAAILAVFMQHDTVFALGVCFTLLFGALILAEPRMSLVAVAFITFGFDADLIEHGFLVPVLGMNFYAMDWILLFSMLSWFIRWSVNGGRVPWTRLTLPLVVFLAILILGVTNGIQNGNALRACLYDFRLFAYYASFFLVIAFVRSPRDLETLFWVIVPFAVIGELQMILWSLSNSMIDMVTGQSYQFGRITGTHEGTYPLMVTASLLFFPFAGSMLKRALLAISASVSLVALALSYTRGSWLAVFGALAIVAVIMVFTGQSRGRSFITVAVSGFGIASVLYVLDMAGIISFNSLFLRTSLLMKERLDISSLARLSEWQTVFGAFLQKPFFGVGLGYIFQYYAIGMGMKEQIFVHNSFLYVLSKMGIIGLVAFLNLLGTAIWLFVRTVKRMHPGVEMGVVYVFGSMLLVFMFKSITTWHLNALFLSPFVGVVLGAIAYFYQYYVAAERP